MPQEASDNPDGDQTRDGGSADADQPTGNIVPGTSINQTSSWPTIQTDPQVVTDEDRESDDSSQTLSIATDLATVLGRPRACLWWVPMKQQALSDVTRVLEQAGLSTNQKDRIFVLTMVKYLTFFPTPVQPSDLDEDVFGDIVTNHWREGDSYTVPRLLTEVSYARIVYGVRPIEEVLGLVSHGVAAPLPWFFGAARIDEVSTESQSDKAYMKAARLLTIAIQPHTISERGRTLMLSFAAAVAAFERHQSEPPTPDPIFEDLQAGAIALRRQAREGSFTEDQFRHHVRSVLAEIVLESAPPLGSILDWVKQACNSIEYVGLQAPNVGKNEDKDKEMGEE